MFVLSGFDIIEKLNSGKKVNTYRGLRCRDKRNFILKAPSQESPDLRVIANLIHEYNLLKDLSLPGVIKVDTLLHVSAHPVLVLEDSGGQTLGMFLNHAPLNINDFFTIALQLVDIVASIHKKHIIHKDINPENIIIDRLTLKIKLIDFGLASELKEEIQEAVNPHKLEGTLSYISPEQTGRVNIPIDYRTDFYSLGVLFFEMLTGEPPFKEEDMLELVYSHLAKTPPLATTINPTVPTMLSLFINKLLAKQPEDRYSHINGLKADLVQCYKEWQAKQKITDFYLGQHDIRDRIYISPKLYGHELEVNQLVSAFDNLPHSKREIMFIAGYSGIGKTSLVKEIYKPMVYQRAYFIQGKFDLLHRSSPYSALIEALSGLINRILEEPERQLHQDKEKILQALGNNGQIIIQVIPLLEHVIGPQPALPNLSQVESKNRFKITFQNFLRCLIKMYSPFVIFIDDMQWADTASLELLQLLLSDNEIENFMFIGAYRDNEVYNDHDLLHLFDNLKKSQIDFHEMHVSPLTEKNIQALLADTLYTSVDNVLLLSQLVLDKTEGNPFFINEFLKMLHAKKLVRFSYETNEWVYDIAEIKKETITDNVADLLLNKIRNLPEELQSILQFASCIGHQFDLHTLATVSNLSEEEVAKRLLLLVRENLILPINEKVRYLLELVNEKDPEISKEIYFKFSHDRIQNTTYQLIAPDKRPFIHLSIGKLLISSLTKSELDKRLYEVLNHFDKCIHLITDVKERFNIATLYYQSGLKAKSDAAYQIAKDKLQLGLTLLPEGAWDENYSLTFNLNKEYAECGYLTGDNKIVDDYFPVLLAKAATLEDKISVYELKIVTLVMINKQTEALALGVETLATLGLHLPKKVKTYHLISILLSIKWQLHGKKIDEIELKEMTDQRMIFINRIAQQIITISHTTDIKLFVLLMLNLLKLSLQHGYTAETPYILYFYSALLLHQLHAYDQAFAFVNLADKIKANFTEIGPSTVKEYMVVAAVLSNYKYPFEVAINLLYKGYQCGLETGSLLYANYCKNGYSGRMYLLGVNLIETLEEMKSAQLLLRTTNVTQFSDYYAFIIQSIHILFKDKELPKFSLPEIIKTINQRENKSEIALLYGCQFMLFYIYGKHKEILSLWPYYKEYKPLVSGTIMDFLALFYYGMALAGAYKEGNRFEKLKYAYELKKVYKQFQRWSSWCPANFNQFTYLIAAEIDKINNNLMGAMQYYNKAYQSAIEADNLLMQCISNEAAALFYLSVNNDYTAGQFLSNAKQLYERWGAVGKAKVLQKKYKKYFVSLDAAAISSNPIKKQTTESDFYNTDIVSILKSNQAISSEIEFEKLLKKMLTIIIQNSCAQRSLLIAHHKNNWYVEAEGDIDTQKIHLQENQLLEMRSDVPLALIKYVMRTKEPILIQDEVHMDQEALSDEYIKKVKPKSLLLMPITHLGELKYILFLENRILSQAFTDTQIHTLKLLSSQMAISIENSKLYYQATHDQLTKLGNRNLFEGSLSQAMAKAKTKHNLVAIFFTDLDGFKSINDSLGHEVGDKFLIKYAERLQQTLPEDCKIFRFGGDEFLIILENMQTISMVEKIAQHLLDNLSQPLYIDGHEIRPYASIGLSIYPNDGDDIQALVKKADMALYRVKEHGKRNYCIFSNTLNTESDEVNLQEAELRQALLIQQFRMVYQPIYSAQHNSITHFEALVRWQHPKKGLVTAEQFISSAEHMGLIIPLGEWILKQVFMQLQAWKNAGLMVKPIAINISGIQLKNQSISHIIEEYLKEYDIDPKYIELEITESILIDQQTVQSDINNLINLGVKITLDDFGTCYSSFSYLKRFPISKIKIERSFTKNLSSNEQDRLIILAIINIAHSLKLKVVAEGIETLEQVQFFKENNVDELQGFYLSKPLDPMACTTLLKNKTKV